MSDNIHFTIPGSYQYEAYKNGICFQKSWHMLKYKRALHLLDLKTTNKVLDAACGSGVLTNLIAERDVVQITGVDFSEASIIFCREKYSRQNLDFIKLDLQQKYFAEHSFDKIVMLEVIEHLSPDTAETVLRNLLFYLKPGGSLIISTPNNKSLWPVIEFMLDTFRLTPKMKDEQHVKLYSRKTLKYLMEKAGFMVAKSELSHFVAPWISFLGLIVSEKMDHIENKIKFLPGSLLFVVAVKKL